MVETRPSSRRKKYHGLDNVDAESQSEYEEPSSASAAKRKRLQTISTRKNDIRGYLEEVTTSNAADRPSLTKTKSTDIVTAGDESGKGVTSDSDEDDQYTGSVIRRARSVAVAPIGGRNDHYDRDKAGFMSLPPEIRQMIYRLIFVTKHCIDFAARSNFAHSAQFLAVNRVVHDEGSTWLYGFNKFVLGPSHRTSGSFWQEKWSWFGYTHVLEFVRMIGERNLASIRYLGLVFHDATISDNHTDSAELRRFENNQDLHTTLAILRKLASGIEMLRLSFGGRRKFWKSNLAMTDVFVLLKGFKADIVIVGELRSENFFYYTRSGQISRLKETWYEPATWGPRLFYEDRIKEHCKHDLVKYITREIPNSPAAIEAYGDYEKKVQSEIKRVQKESGHTCWHHMI